MSEKKTGFVFVVGRIVIAFLSSVVYIGIMKSTYPRLHEEQSTKTFFLSSITM